MLFRFCLLLFCIAPLRVDAQEPALLLGWRVGGEGASRAEQVAPSYRSLLIYAENDGAYRAQAGAGLVVSGREGPLRIGVKKSRYNAWDETFVWAAPPGGLPEYSGIDSFNGEYCRGYRTQTLRFASSAHVAVETRSAGYCEGTASPWDFRTLSVLRTDSLVGDGLDVQAVLGDDGLESFFDSAEAFLTSMPDSRRARYLPEPDPANWSMVHRRGRWQLVGRLESADLGRSASVVDYDVAFDVPAEVTGAQGQLRWDRVLEAARDARDAFVSPSGRLVAIQRPLLLTVHPVQNGRIQPAVLGQPLPQGVTAVAVQWIDARAAQRVRQALRGGGSR